MPHTCLCNKSQHKRTKQAEYSHPDTYYSNGNHQISFAVLVYFIFGKALDFRFVAVVFFINSN